MFKFGDSIGAGADRHPASDTGTDKRPDLLRRGLVASLVIGACAFLPGSRLLAASGAGRIDVWASPSCGCCKEWAKHLQANGYEVEMHYEGNSDARKRLGMPAQYGSCHTGEVAGYAVEGHVPAADIARLVEEAPDAVGLSVPAMPRGSPGMDGPAYGGTVDPYDVLLIAHDGSAEVWQSYG